MHTYMQTYTDNIYYYLDVYYYYLMLNMIQIKRGEESENIPKYMYGSN